MQKQQRVAAIHDISCFGKCSLTVALPIISAAGIECSAIPTAVLSTHTGGFTGFTYRDLTEDILLIVNHWCSLSLPFDAVYTGFVGSIEQLSILVTVFEKLKNSNTKIFVDPVMADNGELYKIFPKDFPKDMKKLVSLADVTMPNITEACLLLDKTYEPGPHSEGYITELLLGIKALGAKNVVLTGVQFGTGKVGAACLCSDGKQTSYMLDIVEGYYHGTGDVFGSALVSAMTKGFDLTASAAIAADFTVGAILRTKKAGTDIRFGVNFEEEIPNFIKALG